MERDEQLVFALSDRRHDGGATKLQLGLQSLSDDVLARNERGHGVAESRAAMALLRSAGFKLHAHWMPNLLGATPDADREDFARLRDWGGLLVTEAPGKREQVVFSLPRELARTGTGA
mgnify:CR=1 FL=1